MQVRITINGGASLEVVIAGKIQQLTAKVDQAVQGAGIDCQAAAKKACPVDTGRLRASIQYTPGKLTCSVGTDVEYGPDIEHGHLSRNHSSFVAARPFLFPAYAKAQANLLKELRSLLS